MFSRIGLRRAMSHVPDQLEKAAVAAGAALFAQGSAHFAPNYLALALGAWVALETLAFVLRWAGFGPD